MTEIFQQIKAALADRYAVEGQIGSGGMATVYLAHDLKHDREVAIKVFRPELAAVIGPERFFREIRIAAKLNHPHILPLHDSGHAEGFLYYVMPLVEGETLRRRLNREKQLPIDEAINITRQIASALDYAHRQGIVHRDIKPENILFHEGEPMVADFGIALAVQAAGGERITETGLSLGTPEYMSPEQATGDRQIDARSDVYSLACVLYEMLAGDPPHTGRTVQSIIAQVLTERPADLRHRRETVSAPLAAAVAKALAKIPADRFESAGRFAHALRPSAIASRAVQWTPPTRRQVAVAGGVVTLVLLALSAWLLLRSGPAPSGLAPAGRLTLLVSSEGRATDPALSPDGKMIAYVRGGADDRDLFVRRVQGGQPVRLTHDRGVEETPAFSPDGETVAFARRDSTGGLPSIWRIPALGGDAQPVAANATMPTWSPDGRFLAFVERQPGALDALVRTRVDGSDRRVVFENEAPYLKLQDPDWSPDGSMLVFVRSTGGVAGELWTIPLEGDGPTRILEQAPGIWAHDPAFTFDGRGVVYSSNRAGTTNLWMQPLGGGRAVRLTTGAGPDASPTVAGDGAVAFVNSRWRNMLFTFDFDTGERRTLLTYTMFIWAPAFSPDGRELAFSRAEVDGSWHVWIVGVDGTGARQLTSGPTPKIYPTFTPDGRWVVYYEWTSPGRIWRVPRKGGPPQALTPEGEDAGYGDVSPDGRLLAYARAEQGTTHVYLRPLDGPGDARRLTDSPGTLPHFSPDGRLIAFTPDRTHIGGVFVIGVDGTGERRVTAEGGWPAWWSDSRRLGYVVVRPGGVQEIRIVDIETGESRPFDAVHYGGTNTPFTVSPGGGLLASSDVVHLADEIWLLEP